MGAGGTWDSGKCGNCGRGLHRPWSCREVAEDEYETMIKRMIKEFGSFDAIPNFEMSCAKARLRNW